MLPTHARLLLALALAACDSGTAPPSARPAPPTTDSVPAVAAVGVRALGTAFERTCGIDDAGSVACAFASDSGRAVRTLPAPDGAAFAALGFGPDGMCAVTTAGAIRCGQGASWGAAFGGEVGFGEVGGQAAHGCALSRAGTPWCWWLESVPRSSSFVTHFDAVTGAPPLTQLGYGYFFACGLERAGVAHCWSFGPRPLAEGQLGVDSVPAPLRAVPVGGAPPFASLSVGVQHACGLTAAGEAWCWGSDMGRALGLPDVAGRPTCVASAPGHWPARWCATPQRVETELRFTALAAGSERTCALTADGRAWCWGANGALALGAGPLGTGACRLVGPLVPPEECTPVPRRVASDVAFAALVESESATEQCAVGVDRRVYCWGNGRGVQVLSGFFFAAGNSTLLRISR